MPHDASETSFFRTLLATQPQLAAVRAQLAQCLLESSDFENAIAEATIALAVDPAQLQAALVRASAQKSLARFEAAVPDFEHAAQLAPDRASILVNLAHCYAELDLVGEAETRLRRAVALDPKSVEAWASFGSILLRHQKPEEAEAACRAALALNPDHLVAHRNLAGLLAARDPAKARFHRDAAYRRQQIFAAPAVAPARRLLLLCAADAANVPLRHLIPSPRNQLIEWYPEYAPPDQDHHLPPFDLIFNAVGDPDLAPAPSPPLTRLLRDHRARVLNHPDSVAATRRSNLPALFAGIQAALVPEVHHGAAPGALEFPLLARPAGTHGGEAVRKIDSPDQLSVLEPGPHYFTKFHDFRSPDGQFRKYRVIFVNGQPLPYHLAIADHWLVHYWTAGMEHSAAKREEERKFLENFAAVLGESAITALRAIAGRLNLDFAGIDFSLLPDGRLLVFEANATMLVHPERDPRFAYRNPAVTAIRAKFDQLLDQRTSSVIFPA